MKFKISFEINAKGTSYSIKNKNDEVTCVIQNLSLILSQLQNKIPERQLSILSSKYDKKLERALLKGVEEEGKLVSQIFHNLKIDGTMEDGKEFTFSHSEPGYKESLIFHEN